jgi:hypothetical protein
MAKWPFASSTRDPYAERDFFTLFGFETIYEGSEFPGFFAIRCGMAIFGLSGNKELPRARRARRCAVAAHRG